MLYVVKQNTWTLQEINHWNSSTYDTRNGQWRTSFATHTKSLKDDLIEGCIGTASQEPVQLLQMIIQHEFRGMTMSYLDIIHTNLYKQPNVKVLWYWLSTIVLLFVLVSNVNPLQNSTATNFSEYAFRLQWKKDGVLNDWCRLSKIFTASASKTVLTIFEAEENERTQCLLGTIFRLYKITSREGEGKQMKRLSYFFNKLQK